MTVATLNHLAADFGNGRGVKMKREGVWVRLGDEKNTRVVQHYLGDEHPPRSGLRRAAVRTLQRFRNVDVRYWVNFGRECSPRIAVDTVITVNGNLIDLSSFG
jgi:hypothetical protein